MTPWAATRIYTPGASTPVQVTPRAARRAELLRGWGAGDRRRVVRVVDERGRDLAPADVDWGGIPGGEPRRRAGRPDTGRDVQTIVRSTEDQREAWDAAASRAGASIGQWCRDALDDAARRR